MARAQQAMLTEENAPKPKKLPTIKRKPQVDAWIVVINDKVLISQIEEVEAEIGEPNCRFNQPFELVQYQDDGDISMVPYLMAFTDDVSFMIHSDKIVTLSKPKSSLKKRYEALIQE